MADLHDHAEGAPNHVAPDSNLPRPDADAASIGAGADTTIADGTDGTANHGDDATAAHPAEHADTDAPVESEEERAAREAEEQLLRLFQSTVYAPDNTKIGRVGQVYLDDQTLAPNWVTVKTGLFGTKEFFVPLDEAKFEGKQILLPYTKEQVLSAPRTEIDQNLSPQEEDDLYNHYRVPGRMTVVDAPAASGDAAAPRTEPASDTDAKLEEGNMTDAEFAETDDEIRAERHGALNDGDIDRVTAEPVAAGVAGEYADAHDADAEDYAPESVADDIAQAEDSGAPFARPNDDSAFAPPADRQ